MSQGELRNDSDAILREVQAGQTISVTRNGVPVADLRAVPQRRFVPRAVIAEAARRAPRVDADRMRADLDAVADHPSMAEPTRGLLDTSVVIDHDIVDPAPLPDESAIAAVALVELAAGPHATVDDAERARRQDRLQ